MRASITSLTDPAWRRLHAHQKAYAEDLLQVLMSQIRPGEAEKRTAVSAKVQKIIDFTKTKPRLVLVAPDCQPVTLRDHGNLIEGEQPFDKHESASRGTALVIAAVDMCAHENISNQVRPGDFFDEVVERCGSSSALGECRIEKSLPLLCLDTADFLAPTALESYAKNQASVLLARSGESQQLCCPGLPIKVLKKERRNALLAALFTAHLWPLSDALTTMKQGNDGSLVLDRHHAEKMHELFSETLEKL